MKQSNHDYSWSLTIFGKVAIAIIIIILFAILWTSSCEDMISRGETRWLDQGGRHATDMVSPKPSDKD